MVNKALPKISVIIICYNQEGIISRAINSVLVQKDYLFELIISDDCSSDKTWDVVQYYQNQFPEKIKAYRNEKNLGVYENLHSTYNKVQGEIVFFLAGDDEFGKDLFKKSCEAVMNAGVNYASNRFCIITDFKVVFPDGTELHNNSNSLVEHYDAFSLKFRGIINNRAFGESITTFKDRQTVFIKRESGAVISSSLQEGFADNLPYVNTKMFFYLPIIGNVYHAGIGISTKFGKNRKEFLIGIIEYCDRIPDLFHNLNKYDLTWLKFHKTKTLFLLEPDMVKYWKYFIMLIKLARDPLRKFFLFKEFKKFIKGIALIFNFDSLS